MFSVYNRELYQIFCNLKKKKLDQFDLFKNNGIYYFIWGVYHL